MSSTCVTPFSWKCSKTKNKLWPWQCYSCNLSFTKLGGLQEKHWLIMTESHSSQITFYTTTAQQNKHRWTQVTGKWFLINEYETQKRHIKEWSKSKGHQDHYYYFWNFWKGPPTATLLCDWVNWTSNVKSVDENLRCISQCILCNFMSYSYSY